MIEENVILVNEADEEIGIMEKMKAHELGVLHRAFSVFVFNSDKELMLQKRADHKYHSASLWTNTCCSHPRLGETLEQAAKRRLNEEMGFACSLTKAFDFRYKSEMPNGLIEHEFDHVFIGVYDGKPILNPEEVGDWKYARIEDIQSELLEKPELYTSWFKICFSELQEYYKTNVA